MSKPMGPREQAMRAMREAKADAFELPSILDRKKNGIKPKTGPLPAAPAPKMEAARKVLATAEAIAAENAERKRQKARGRIARMKAKQSGATAAMPLSGKAAIAAIKAAEPAQHLETPMTKKTKSKTKSKKPAAKKKTGRKASASPKMREGNTKLAAVVALLTRPGGCTSKDALAATGWPAISMPQQAKSAGLTLRKEKIDGVFHYSADAPAA